MNWIGRSVKVDWEESPQWRDPNEEFVGEANRDFPNPAAPSGIKTIIQIVVWTVLRMKERGLI